MWLVLAGESDRENEFGVEQQGAVEDRTGACAGRVVTARLKVVVLSTVLNAII